MPTVLPRSVTCRVCGRESTHPMVLGADQSGAPDLDLRPPEPARSTMKYWMQRCPSCGYCAPDLGEAPATARGTVDSEGYRRQLAVVSLPSLAVSFLCWSRVQEAEGELADAGWVSLQAAWACDDTGPALGAERCRERAIGLFRRARSAGIHFAGADGAEEALLADLLRRCGRFEEADAMCYAGLALDPDEPVRSVLHFEQYLAGRSDRSRYTMEDAEEFAP